MPNRREESVGQKGRTPHGLMDIPLADKQFHERVAHPSKGQLLEYQNPYKGKKKRQGYVRVRY